MNAPEDKTLCLAHGNGRALLPPAWCERYRDCARHQAISQVANDISYTAEPRVCKAGKFDQFLAVDRSIPEDAQ